MGQQWVEPHFINPFLENLSSTPVFQLVSDTNYSHNEVPILQPDFANTTVDDSGERWQQ